MRFTIRSLNETLKRSGLHRAVRRIRASSRRARYQSYRHPSGDLRLHLGCGDKYWPGYVNIDADPAANADCCLDFTRIRSAFSENSASEIAMIHSLSYLRLWQARDLLRDLLVVMQPGGKLVIELPDLAKCARKAIESEGDAANYLEAVRGLYAFGMDQVERREAFTPYAFGWSSWHLRRELEQAGFRDVRVADPQTHDCRVWRDTRIEATK